MKTQSIETIRNQSRSMLEPPVLSVRSPRHPSSDGKYHEDSRKSGGTFGGTRANVVSLDEKETRAKQDRIMLSSNLGEVGFEPTTPRV